MTTTDFSLTLMSERTPQEVFKAVTNVRAWWTGYYNEKFKGNTEKLGDEFTFHAGDGAHYSRQKLVEVVPDKKIVWLITDSNLSFVDTTDEWTGTKIIFDISVKKGKTQLVFTHEGLHRDFECYDACAPAWTQYLTNKLFPLMETTRL